MTTQITHNIKISVRTRFQEEHSSPNQRHYLFSYHIIIENNSEYTIQLLRRHWHIFDSSGEYREVEGEGVVGEQPILASGEVYQYESACNLSTEIGKMYGTYLMERKIDGTQFNVDIPEFELIVPSKMN